jgi:hypothetical protein
MTHKEAIEYWELFNSEIDDLLPGTYGACKKALEEQREAVEFTIAALRRIDALALDGKHDEGCAWCKAEYTIIDDEFAQPINQKMIKFCWHCGRKLEGNNESTV